MTRRPSDVVAERVRQYRKRLGWSVRRLAEECADLGAPELTEASLGNIERGANSKRKRRDVTVDELMVLGYALGVPPLMLAVPLGENEFVRLVPPYELHPQMAWSVVTGRSPLVENGNFALKLSESAEARRTVEAFDDLHEAHTEFERARARYKGLPESASPRRREEIGERWSQAKVAYAEAVEMLIALGLDVPQVRKETLEDLLDPGVITDPTRIKEWVMSPEFAEAWNRHGLKGGG